MYVCVCGMCCAEEGRRAEKGFERVWKRCQFYSKVRGDQNEQNKDSKAKQVRRQVRQQLSQEEGAQELSPHRLRVVIFFFTPSKMTSRSLLVVILLALLLVASASGTDFAKYNTSIPRLLGIIVFSRSSSLFFVLLASF